VKRFGDRFGRTAVVLGLVLGTATGAVGATGPTPAATTTPATTPKTAPKSTPAARAPRAEQYCAPKQLGTTAKDARGRKLTCVKSKSGTTQYWSRTATP
jgi:hypothetical protein